MPQLNGAVRGGRESSTLVARIGPRYHSGRPNGRIIKNQQDRERPRLSALPANLTVLRQLLRQHCCTQGLLGERLRIRGVADIC